MKHWFENEPREPERRKNRLQRIAHDSQVQEESQIDRWLDLAKKVFDKDDDPSAA